MKPNIFLKNGFEYKKDNVNNELHNCYEKYIQLNDAFCAWVAYNIKDNEGLIVVELDCGGFWDISPFYTFTEFKDNEEECYKEVEQEINNLKKFYPEEDEENND